MCIRDSPWAAVENVVVDDRYHRRGVGRALMEEAARRAREADCHRLQLLSSQRRTEAYKEAHAQGGNGRVYVATPVFDGATVEDVDHALVKWQDAHTGRIRMDIDKSRRNGEQASGKMTLFNGRTGEPFEEQVTVGYMYILKLLHLCLLYTSRCV